MGERVNTLKPAMLYAEVRAFETPKGTAEQSVEDKVAYAYIESRREGLQRGEGEMEEMEMMMIGMVIGMATMPKSIVFIADLRDMM